LVGADTDDLQQLLGRSYPAHGKLSGQFHGKGTRASPDIRDYLMWQTRQHGRGALTVRADN